MLMNIVKSIGDLKILKIHKTMFVSRREKDGPKGREREKECPQKGKESLIGYHTSLPGESRRLGRLLIMALSWHFSIA